MNLGSTDGSTGGVVRALMADALALPRPAGGATAHRHLHLADVGRTRSVSVARLYEAHTDAIAILAEAGHEPHVDALYGVWASEGGPSPLRYDPRRRRLDGTKAFCSGLGLLDRALVTARLDGDQSGCGVSVLVDTSVRPADSITMSSAGWRSDALVDTATGTVDFRDHPGVPVGGPGWYLDRPGFWHGACGPAACWAGGAMGLIEEAEERIDDDPHRLAHLGAMLAAAWSLRALLVQAGDEIDRDPDDIVAGERRAWALRWTTERTVTDVIDRFGRGFGPRPQTESAGVAHRIADLQLYVRQHHAERELAVLRATCPQDGVAVNPNPELGGEGRLSALTHRRTYFDELYRNDGDPWGFEARWYERRKRDITMAALPNARYQRAVEPGCSIGTLTARLAERVDELIAFDFVADAVETARRRVDRSNVTIVDATFPLFWPVGTGDLVVWSEVAYYLTDGGFDLALRGVRRWLEPGGHLVAVHYTGETDYPRPGREVAMRIDQDTALQRLTTVVDPDFELAVWERRPG